MAKEQSLQTHTLVANAWILLRCQRLWLEEASEHAHHRFPEEVFTMVLRYLAQLLAAIFVRFIAIWVILYSFHIPRRHCMILNFCLRTYKIAQIRWRLEIQLWVYSLSICSSLVLSEINVLFFFLCEILSSYKRTLRPIFVQNILRLAACFKDVIVVFCEAWPEVICDLLCEFQICAILMHESPICL